MIDRQHALSIAKQAEALGIRRGAGYYVPRLRSTADLALMRRIDEVHLEMPWFGARGLCRVLRPEFPGVGRRHLATLMRAMGISAPSPRRRAGTFGARGSPTGASDSFSAVLSAAGRRRAAGPRGAAAGCPRGGGHAAARPAALAGTAIGPYVHRTLDRPRLNFLSRARVRAAGPAALPLPRGSPHGDLRLH
jgi:hypothetical protein